MTWTDGRCASAFVLVAVVACNRGARDKQPAPAPAPVRAPGPAAGQTACPADGLGELHASTARPAACEHGDEPACGRACDRGDAAACYVRALASQTDPGGAEQARKLFRQSCELGLAVGCTNYGAGLWQGDDPAGWACARRLFDKACDGHETFGCGMLGRVIIEDKAAGERELAYGRAVLERACDRLGGFSCRALALELEKEKLGPYERAQIRKLLARACATDDQDACTGRDSALATFQ